MAAAFSAVLVIHVVMACIPAAVNHHIATPGFYRPGSVRAIRSVSRWPSFPVPGAFNITASSRLLVPLPVCALLPPARGPAWSRDVLQASINLFTMEFIVLVLN
ncbi:MAG: hypothetical protein BZY88_16460 [SAR202 cluster bacterium Io17-Chloro-G9]|nr:MAG: hypothetical protein BZY88_16460 [SAR202 cluster bacterium Io17-Chloro-G9]